MERVTVKKQIGKHEVEIKSYATPREINVVRSTITDNKQDTSKQEEAFISQLVVSVNGNKSNVVNFILDNFEFTTEYVPLIEELAKVVDKKK